MRRFRQILTSLVVLLAVPGVLNAQTGAIVGSVVDASNNRPLASAQVFIPGTNIGSLTGQTGRFALTNVPPGNHAVRVLLIGYAQQDQTVNVAPGATAEVGIRLQSVAVAIEGLVVTALGMERQARTLGVATQQIAGNELSRVAPNIVTSLQGRVSGVNITSATTQGGSSRIVIRGENSLKGNNQALFVIDGVPVDNYTGVPQPGIVVDQGGYDYGTLINDLDPDQIENITILKGPNAAALYGSRASNGVIIIETKKGRSSFGRADITASQTVTWEDILRLPKYQNQYGQGHAGLYSYYDGHGGGVYDEYDESWGPPLDKGLMLPQWNSKVTGHDASGKAILEPLPWVSQPDNVRDFYETGNTAVTNVSAAAATERLNGRVGLSRFDQNGIVPGFGLTRTTLSFAGGMQATTKLNLNSSLQYLQHEGENRPAQGYDNNNPQQMGIWFGRQVDMSLLKANYLNRFPAGHPLEGVLMSWQHQYWNNPYYLQLANHNQDDRDRLIGQVQATYQFASWLDGKVGTSLDWYNDTRLKAWAEGNCCGNYTTNPFNSSRDYIDEVTGAFSNWELGFREVNTDFLFTANPTLSTAFTTTFSFGGNRRDWHRTTEYVWVGKLATPGIFNVSNAASTPQNYNRDYKKRVNSLYGQVELGYNNYLFLTGTGRNDWSSTLPDAHRSFFYPSVSASFVFTDAFPSLKSSTLTYGKARASWARVGNDTDPYQLQNVYSASEIWDGNPTFTIPAELQNADLKPETTESKEFGVELGFYEDRLGLDLTYYIEDTKDQIMPVSVSPTTGYESRWLNAGTVENKGWELLLRGVPLRGSNLRWETSVTWSKNKNTVVDLAEGVEALEITLKDFWGTQLFARKGEPYGQMVGRAYARAPDGQIITGSFGQPTRTPTPQVIGNIQPDWIGGWSNQLTYGPVTLISSMDWKHGGDLVSVTKMWGTYTGVLAETAGKGRCNRSAVAGSTYPVCDKDTGIIFPGVRRTISGKDTTYAANVIPIDGGTLATYNNYFIPEADIIDAGYIKLRELGLTYSLPKSISDKARLAGIDLSLIGRNLLLWTPSDNPHIDPETSTEATNVQGFEYGQSPPARSIGFTVSLRP